MNKCAKSLYLYLEIYYLSIQNFIYHAFNENA